jgi:ATP adenylyltransferase
MDRMWSPWRSEHLDSFEARHRLPGKGSLFSRIAAQPERDHEHLVLWRGPSVFVLMNLYPYNNGHLMVVPYREVEDYTALTSEEQREIAHTVDRCMRWLRYALAPDGFNVGINQGAAAGAGIPEHLHVHVVPRWRGDTNFMPVVGQVKVIPEAMETTFRKLREAVAQEGASTGE